MNGLSVVDLLDRARRLEDCPEQRELFDELARRVTTRYRLRGRHLLALHDHSSWADEGPLVTLHRLAFTVVGTLIAEDRTAPDDLVKEARRRLNAVLDSGRRVHNDARRMVSMDALGDAPSHAPTPDEVLEAEELRDAILAHPDLTPAERRVARARAELGPDATGREIAETAGMSEDTERTLTKRMRRKLLVSFTKSAPRCPT